MTKTRVYIATTEGPSEIQGIIEEDSDLQSVICLDGTASALPVSTGYDAFVRKPTGVVERVTENRVYRMDVSHAITNGNSWQLGAYIAHMLAHSSNLAEKDVQADHVIITTGALRTRDLHVDQVGHVAEKLEAAKSLLTTENVQFFLPAADFDALPDQLIERYQDQVTFVPLENADDIVTKLFGEAIAGKPKPKDISSTIPVPVAAESQTAKSSSKTWTLVIIAIGTLLVSGGGYLFSQWQIGLGLQKELARMTRNGHYADIVEFKANPAFDSISGKIADYFFPIAAATGDLRFEISQVTPDDAKTCAGARFRDVRRKVERISPTGADNNQYNLKNSETLCSFEVSMHNKGAYDLNVLSLIKPNMVMGRFLSTEEGGDVESFNLPANASRTIEIKLPLYRNRAVDYDIWMIGTRQQSRQIYEMLQAESSADNSLAFDWGELRRVGVNILEAKVSIGD